MKSPVYNPNERAYDLPKVKDTSVNIWMLNRPRSILEMNKFKETPFTKRICNGCNKTLGEHWQRPVHSQDVANLYCYRDGSSVSVKHFTRI